MGDGCGSASCKPLSLGAMQRALHLYLLPKPARKCSGRLVRQRCWLLLCYVQPSESRDHHAHAPMARSTTRAEKKTRAGWSDGGTPHDALLHSAFDEAGVHLH